MISYTCARICLALGLGYQYSTGVALYTRMNNFVCNSRFNIVFKSPENWILRSADTDIIYLEFLSCLFCCPDIVNLLFVVSVLYRQDIIHSFSEICWIFVWVDFRVWCLRRICLIWLFIDGHRRWFARSPCLWFAPQIRDATIWRHFQLEGAAAIVAWSERKQWRKKHSESSLHWA